MRKQVCSCVFLIPHVCALAEKVLANIADPSMLPLTNAMKASLKQNGELRSACENLTTKYDLLHNENDLLRGQHEQLRTTAKKA